MRLRIFGGIMKKFLKTIFLSLTIGVVCLSALLFSACRETEEPSGSASFSSAGEESSGNDRPAPDGNADEYSLANTPVLDNSPLEGMTIYWLGSSVTYGEKSEGESVADFLAKRNRCVSIKEAVGGTTLRMEKGRTDSYVERLQNGNLPADDAPDLFICQLSTNEVRDQSLYGEPTADDVLDKEKYDLYTSCGAIEYIICYAKEQWNCPIAFWSSPDFMVSRYKTLVEKMKVIAEKHDIFFWNMYEESLPPEDSYTYALYLADNTHPTRAGYREWFTPYFEEKIEESKHGFV